MIDDPYTYDISELAIEFTWSILFWNAAESDIRELLCGLLGDTAAVHSLIADMGGRSLGEALHSVAKDSPEKAVRAHLEHLAKGYSRLGEYRNLYIHGLFSVLPASEPNHRNEKKLTGFLHIKRGKGRLRVTHQSLPTSELRSFKEACLGLRQYAEAIKAELGFSDPTFREMLGMPESSLEKPKWPDPPKQQIHYLQE